MTLEGLDELGGEGRGWRRGSDGFGRPRSWYILPSWQGKSTIVGYLQEEVLYVSIHLLW